MDNYGGYEALKDVFRLGFCIIAFIGFLIIKDKKKKKPLFAKKEKKK